MSVSSAAVTTPASVPRSTIVRASSRALSRSFMNAPVPTLTSSTSTPVPSAIFLDMIEAAIIGMDSTVPGDVPQRVELLVCWREFRACSADHRAGVGQLCVHLLVRDVRAPAVQ